MPTLEFDKWLPDFSPKAPGLIQCENLLPFDRKYGVFNDATELTSAITGVPLFMFQTQDDGGSKANFIGTTTKIYRYITGASATDVTSLGGPYTTASNVWDYDTRGDKAFMTNLDDELQVLSDMIAGSNFADVSGPPTAQSRTIAWYRDQLFMGYNEEGGTTYPRRVRRSAKGDETDWTTTASGAGHKDIDAWGQSLIALRTITDFLLVYMDNSVWYIDELGPPLWFSYKQIYEGDGPIGIHAVARLGTGTHIFLGKHDAYLVQGLSVTPLNAPCKKTVIQNIDPDNAFLTTHYVDKANSLVTWIYTESGQSIPSRMLHYNYAEDRWSEGNKSAYCVGSFASPGYTINGLDALSATIDGLPNLPIDSAFYNGGAFAPGIVTLDKKIGTLSGNPLNSVIETGDIDFDTNARIDGLRPIIEQPTGTVTGTIKSRFRDNDVATQTSSSTMGSNGVADVRSTGRMHRIQINTSGNHSGKRGVKYDAKPVGERR
jgi:hypothetical protein